MTIPSADPRQAAAHGIRAAQWGLVVNAELALVKLIAGIVGNSYALIADAIESTTDIFSSLIVWAGLHVAALPADEEHPYGHGKAEALAAAMVALMLFGAAAGIAVSAAREIVSPHRGPAPFTLVVLAGVIVVKELLFRTVLKTGDTIGSTAVKSDAWHHRSDAITSAAAFIGIAIALWGGKGWESADDWAALVAALVIALNGARFLSTAAHELMDRTPDMELTESIDSIARAVPGVRATEKLRVRKVGLEYHVDLHVQADPNISLHEAHILSGKVKSAIKAHLPTVKEVLVHMEPWDG